MELTFNKVGNKYEAEFELSADANLHVEFKNAAVNPDDWRDATLEEKESYERAQEDSNKMNY